MNWKLGIRGLGATAAAAVVVGCSSDGGSTAPTPVPTTVVLSGNMQSGMIGTVLANPIGLTVRDQSGDPFPGLEVSFVVNAGGGLVTALDTTNAQGFASTSWTLGNTVGSGNNGVVATVAEYTGAQPTFTASATPIVSQYNIQIQFLSSMTPSQTSAFTSAAERWRSILVGDLPSARVIAAPGDCFENSPAMDQVVDDILIFATIDSIDGPGGILGGAAPCWIRDAGALPIVGGMVFDSADMAEIEALGVLDAAILHEMGHVLGIGTLWTYMSPSLLIGEGGVNPYFNGANGVFRFKLDGGNSYPGTPVPVENSGGPGTQDAHWRESVMGRELMTGYVSLTANPLSTITIGSLADMKYTVSYANADPYTVSPVNLRLEAAEPALHLREFRPNVELRSVDGQGRVRRVGQGHGGVSDR